MKLYQVKHDNKSTWVTSDSAAASERAKLTKAGVPRAQIETSEHEFTPTKTGIVELLNKVTG